MAVNWGLAGNGFDGAQVLQSYGLAAQQRLRQEEQAREQQAMQRQQQTRQAVAGTLAGGDFRGARQTALEGGDLDLVKTIGSLEEQQREVLQAQSETYGALAVSLKGLPAEARRAAFASAAPRLGQLGFSPEELQGMDLSDAGLTAAIGMATSAKDALAAYRDAQKPVTLSEGSRLYRQDGSLIADNPKEDKPDYVWDSERGAFFLKPGSGSGAPGSVSMASPSSGGGGSNVPRSVRNNNPGNIVDSAFARSQPGYKGSDGRFAIFDSQQAGAGAQANLLASYIDRGFNTVQKIINRWAPPSDGNNTSAYVNQVARALNVNPGDTLSKSSIPKLQAIISRVEGGPGPSSGISAAPQPQGLPQSVQVATPKVREADKQYRMLTPQEARSQGLDGNTRWQVSPSGQIAALPSRGDKPLTEGQAKAVGYLEAASAAVKTLNQVSGYSPSEVSVGLSQLSAGNPLKRNMSQVDRRVLNAQLAFATGVVRLESGAVFGPAEYAQKAQTLFPAPGDGPDVQADKRRQREAALRALRAAAGPGSDNVPSSGNPNRPKGGGATFRAGETRTVGRFKIKALN